MSRPLNTMCCATSAVFVPSGSGGCGHESASATAGSIASAGSRRRRSTAIFVGRQLVGWNHVRSRAAELELVEARSEDVIDDRDLAEDVDDLVGDVVEAAAQPGRRHQRADDVAHGAVAAGVLAVEVFARAGGVPG